MGFHILFQIYAYLKNHNIDYFNLFFNNIFLAFQDQIIPQTKQFIFLIWINGVEWTFAWMQLLGKIFIYIYIYMSFYWNILYILSWVLQRHFYGCISYTLTLTLLSLHHCPRESHIYFHITNDSVFLYKT